jgi:DNA replication licensing factor MCM6
MEAFGGFFVDEKAARVENIFLEFLKRWASRAAAAASGSAICMSSSFRFCPSDWGGGDGVLGLCRFKESDGAGEPFYEAEMEVMRSRESTTMYVDFAHVMRFNDVLQKAISEEYLRSD